MPFDDRYPNFLHDFFCTPETSGEAPRRLCLQSSSSFLATSYLPSVQGTGLSNHSTP
ncbi:hypothetical protein OUZ56_028436 [Daphnia magna]|uniref:Uncharacterized protein n=1 Tax=Daphnia magna TaxID=35525 RepID=A0ABR0B4F1_9CRUS|nr:hypothetical protein OUZ56_028436 [Daphnia magna]